MYPPRARPRHLISLLVLSMTLVVAMGAWPQDIQSHSSDKAEPVFINGEPVYKVGGDVVAPHPVYSPDPEYSEEARRVRLRGICVLSVILGKDGKPYDVRVERSLGMGLDEKSIEAIRAWRFEPARKNGQPVAVHLNVETSFWTDSPVVSLDPLPAAGTESTQLPVKNTDRYPLLVDVRFVTGKDTDDGYVVNAEATISEGAQPHKVTISCGPKGKCFMLNSGKYPARRLNANEMELLGRKDGKWQKARFSVVPSP
jgi:TonB family protein